MAEKIMVGSIEILIKRKRIKNIYLSISAFDGQVSVSAPFNVGKEALKIMTLEKLPWLERHLARINGLGQLDPINYSAGEKLFLWGKPYELELVVKQKRSIEVKGNGLTLSRKIDDGFIEKEKMVNNWYRKCLQEKLTIFVDKWEKIIGVKANEVRIKNMKSRWGSCNIRAKRLWFNLQLAKKPLEGLEYVVVHELIHLLAEKHDWVFFSYLTKYMPDWRQREEVLNRPNEQKRI